MIKPRTKTLITLAFTAFCASQMASAEARQPSPGAFPAPGEDLSKCPKDHDRISQSETGRASSKWCVPPKARSGGTSASSGASQATYIDPVFAEVAKPNPFARCPTGHYTKGEVCSASWEEAPKSRLKTGACPTGTIEEWGAYCTDKPKDTSDRSLDLMDGNNTRDFNTLYVAAQSARRDLPRSSDEPAAFVAAKAIREAAGSPWKSKPERERADAASKQAAQPVEPPLNRADVSPECHPYMPDRPAVMQCEQIVQQQRASQARLGLTPTAPAVSGTTPSEAGKAVGNAVGGALKGLLGR
jgi:hypothetical protein